MSVKLNSVGGGSVTLQEPNTASDFTISLPAVTDTAVTLNATQTLTNKTIQGGAITSGTSLASTSGTSIDFTGIPSWVKRITVMFNSVSTNGNSGIGFQVGSGSITTTGYTGSSFNTAGAGLATNILSTNVYNQASINSAASVTFGHVVFTNISGNIWIFTLTSGRSDSAQIALTVGSISLSGVLDRVRMMTVNGTDTFDAGSVNILYE